MKNILQKAALATSILAVGHTSNSLLNAKKAMDESKQMVEEALFLSRINDDFLEFNMRINSVLDVNDYLQGNMLYVAVDFGKRDREFQDFFEMSKQGKSEGGYFKWMDSKKLFENKPIKWDGPKPTVFGEFLTIDTSRKSPIAKFYSAYEMEKFFFKAFPSGWNSNLALFEQAPKRLSMPSDYGMDSDELEAMTESEIGNGEKPNPEIKITYNILPIADQSSPDFTRVLAHEVCHTNDFVTIQYLGLNQRLELLQRLTERVYAENRFRSSYVEDIKGVGDNLKRTNYRKVSEYFAEICAAWFEDSEKLGYEDRLLMEYWVKQVDPEYSRDYYQQAKKTLLNSAEDRSFVEATEKLSPSLKELLKVRIELDYMKRHSVELEHQTKPLVAEIDAYVNFLRFKLRNPNEIYIADKPFRSIGILRIEIAEMLDEMNKTESKIKQLEKNQLMLFKRNELD